MILYKKDITPVISGKRLWIGICVLVLIAASAVEIWYSCEKSSEESALDDGSRVVFSDEALWKSMLAVKTDKELGEPYKVYPIDVAYPDGNSYHATLVEYPFGESPRAVKTATDSVRVAEGADSANVVPVVKEEKFPRGIMLYLHGFNDYFFHKEMAEKADSAGFAFFAIDIHNAGRSLREGDPRCDMRNIREFFRELDFAVALSRQVVKERVEKMAIARMRDSIGDGVPDSLAQQSLLDAVNRALALPYVLEGHSQGGLIMSLYADSRQGENFAAVVLNSPFVEMNFNWIMRKAVAPLLSELAIYFPDAALPATGNDNYAKSLHRGDYGEWEYNTEYKTPLRPKQYIGWVRAIHKGQRKLQKGLHINSPVLVMRSGCSVDEDEWVEDYMRCDGVLDVEHIGEFALGLGGNVTLETLEGALHDVLLSKRGVRDDAYGRMFRFVDSVIGRP